MARIGLKGLTYAKVSGGGAGSAVTYTGGATLPDLMIAANVTLNRQDVKQFADDHLVERDNGMTSTTIALELARLPAELKTGLLGYEAGSSSQSDELSVVEDPAPYVGFGYITKEVTNNVASYVGYWHYKVQFGLNDDNASTKGENTQFQSSNLTGEGMGVQLSSGGKITYYVTKSASTEAAIRTWLNGLAGITP